MADNHEPMSELRLEQMRGYAEAIRTAKHAIESVSSELVHASDYILTLIGEVDRLRVREAAAMEIVRAVAAHGDDVFIGAYDQYGAREDDVCAYCERSLWEDNDSQHPSHALDCPVTKARALLAQKEAE